MIFHIAERSVWESSLRNGEYQVSSLRSEGFIHCSTVDQFVRVADFLFKGRQGLILLEIDESKLKAQIKWEGETEELFPHLYGALNVDAVVKIHEFKPQANGYFHRPDTLGI